MTEGQAWARVLGSDPSDLLYPPPASYTPLKPQALSRPRISRPPEPTSPRPLTLPRECTHGLAQVRGRAGRPGPVAAVAQGRRKVVVEARHTEVLRAAGQAGAVTVLTQTLAKRGGGG